MSSHSDVQSMLLHLDACSGSLERQVKQFTTHTLAPWAAMHARQVLAADDLQCCISCSRSLGTRSDEKQ